MALKNSAGNLRKITLKLCKTNPILSAVHVADLNPNPFMQTTYENFCPFSHPKNKAKTNPNKPNLKNDKNGCKLIANKGLRTKIGPFPQKKQSQNKPKQSQSRAKSRDERNLFISKGLRTKIGLFPPKKQTQSNPILSAGGGFHLESKNEHKLFLHKGLRKYPLLELKKTNPILSAGGGFKPNFSKTKMVIETALKMVHVQPKNKPKQYLIAVFFKSWCNE